MRHTLDDANRAVEKAGTVSVLIKLTFHWINQNYNLSDWKMMRPLI